MRAGCDRTKPVLKTADELCGVSRERRVTDWSLLASFLAHIIHHSPERGGGGVLGESDADYRLQGGNMRSLGGAAAVGVGCKLSGAAVFMGLASRPISIESM